MNVMRKQIRELFTNPIEVMYSGLWFSGYEQDGEFRAWHKNGQLWRIVNIKKSVKHGEYQAWHEDGKPWIHRLYKDNDVIKDYLK